MSRTPAPTGASSDPPEDLVISAEASRAFGELSGDFNPQHLDPVVARRTLFGRTVVHGMHAATSALDVALRGGSGPLTVRKLSIHFYLPIGTHEPFGVGVTGTEDGRLRCKVMSRGRLAILVDLEADRRLALPGREVEDLAFEAAAADVRSSGDIGELAGDVPLRLNRTLVRQLLPTLAERIDARQLAVVLSTTTIVGMRCPGYHSIFKSVSLVFDGTEPTTGDAVVHYAVKRFAPELSFCSMAVSAPGVSGKIDAVLRPAPVIQPSFAAIKQAVRFDRTSGCRVLVVGGSRGLGEVTAKIAAAAGAEVLITYRSGEDDARAVVADIRSGGGRAVMSRFDAAASDATALSALVSFNPTHVFYFATPRISLSPGSGFDHSLFASFYDIYVAKLHGLLDALRTARAKDAPPLTVLSPSSVYVAAPTPGLGEYAAAKAACELFCRTLAASSDGSLTMLSPRLPRVATDQTSTPIKEDTVDILDIMVPIVRDALQASRAGAEGTVRSAGDLPA